MSQKKKRGKKTRPSAASTGELSDLQKRFVAEYLIDLNATAAASRAGYKHPNKQGPALLVNLGIAAAIAAAAAKVHRKLEIKAETVLAEQARLAFSDIGHILDFSGDTPRLRAAKDIPEDARRAISSVKIKRQVEGHGEDAREVEVMEFRLWPKGEALGKLMQHLDLLKTSLDVNLGVSRQLEEAMQKALDNDDTASLLATLTRRLIGGTAQPGGDGLDDNAGQVPAAPTP